ncbi:MAG TPA: DUF4962 domain-containing protein [archaeon]|nr:DUF4962 domain-containing protein [archaeon]
MKSRFFPCLVVLMTFAFLSCSRTAPAKADLSLEVAEPEVTGQQLIHYPEDGQQVGVNPPGFTWTAHPRASSYRFVLFKGREAEEAIHVLDGLSSTVAVLDSPLELGEYSWLVAYRGSSGGFFGRSALRRFIVGEGLEVLVMPDMAGLAARLAGIRPRLFLLPGEMERIKGSIARGESPFWQLCRSLADSALSEPLYPEPAPYKDGKFEVNEWRRIYTPGKVGSAHAVRLALVYRLTGERKYLEGAKKWLVHLAGWDPYGITSYNLHLPDGSTGNDEAGMPLLQRMAIAFDWLAGELTPEEKSIILGSLKARGNQLLEHYQEKDFLSNPWSNHDGRALAFFGLAGLSCLGELPEAERWLEYALRSYLTSYPSWGGDEGGWAQGLSYWSSYILRHTFFLDALPLATGVDLYQKPFFRNNGFFALYFHPPYAKRGAFGDGGEGAPNLDEKLLLQKYTLATGNPVFLWHAEHIKIDPEITSRLRSRDGTMNWKQWAMEDVAAVLGAVPAGIEPKPPTELPGSKWLRDIGWVAMHSALGDAENDVWALFKASRYGSISHSHADQNSFQMNAYGEPLLIDSGYYPWYGSPHHILWTRQTRAHNAVLVNGRGQGNFSMAANGTIEVFRHTGNLTFARGEAKAAYNVPLSEETLRQWKDYLSEPLPSMEPKVLLARRSLAFAGSKDHPWLAVHDYLETDGSAVFDYLLHALEKMELDQEQGTILVKRGRACLLVYLLSDTGLSFSQSGKFFPPPEDRYEGAPEQWHFAARTTEEKDRMRFLALYVPFREGDTPPAVEKVVADNVRGFRIGDERVLAWWGEDETGKYEDYGEGREGRLFILLSEDGGMKKYLCE